MKVYKDGSDTAEVSIPAFIDYDDAAGTVTITTVDNADRGSYRIELNHDLDDDTDDVI